MAQIRDPRPQIEALWRRLIAVHVTQEDGRLTVPQAARAVGTTPGKLRTLIRRGDLKAITILGTAFVHPDDLLEVVCPWLTPPPGRTRRRSS